MTRIPNTPEYIADLARLTAAELSMKYGGNRHVHKRARQRHHVASPPVQAGQRRTERPWHALLGTQSDRSIATAFGISSDAVRAARVLRGIAPWITREEHLRAFNVARHRKPALVVAPKPAPVVAPRPRRIPRPPPLPPLRDEEPPADAPIRVEVVTPSAPVGLCSFEDDCRCQFCRRTHRVERGVFQ